MKNAGDEIFGKTKIIIKKVDYSSNRRPVGDSLTSPRIGLLRRLPVGAKTTTILIFKPDVNGASSPR